MRYSVFFLAAFFLFSCKKDVDENPPTVSIQQPVDGLQADVFDNIHVVMNVTDDVELARVEVKLVDVNQVAAMPTAMITTGGTGGTLQIDYFLDDITLPTGQYYIQAQVYDAAGNSTKDFVMVYITAVPKALKGIFAVTTVPGFVTLHAIDTAFTLSSYGTFQGDFTDLAVSSWWQQVAYTGSVNGMLRCFSIDGAHPGWTVSPFSTTGPYWGNIVSHDRDWLINYRADGLLKTVSFNNSITRTNTANAGYFFHRFVYSGGNVFADMVDATGTSRILGVYVSGGGAVQQAVMNMDPVALLPRDDMTIYAIGNDAAQQGKLWIYDYSQNGFWEPIALPAGKVLSATEVDAGTLLIAMDNGNIYKFTYSPVGLLVWLPVTAQHVRYDEADGTVITCEGTAVKQYDYPLTGILNQVALPDTAQDIELWYNR